MGCARLCGAEMVFLFINIAFAMYAGALLCTAARLAWDPSTYTWFRFLCATQYRVTAAYLLAAGAALAALAALAAAATSPRLLHLYAGGVVVLAVSELSYGAWMGATLTTWWRSAPEAELARRSLDLLHDLKPALLAVERYRDVARPLLAMIEEVEHEAPNNVYVIGVFATLGAALQLAAVLLARRLAVRRARASRPGKLGLPSDVTADSGGGGGGDSDSEAGDASPAPPAPGAWRKHAHLRMYTILDKIF